MHTAPWLRREFVHGWSTQMCFAHKSGMDWNSYSMQSEQHQVQCSDLTEDACSKVTEGLEVTIRIKPGKVVLTIHVEEWLVLCLFGKNRGNQSLVQTSLLRRKELITEIFTLSLVVSIFRRLILSSILFRTINSTQFFQRDYMLCRRAFIEVVWAKCWGRGDSSLSFYY